MGGYLSLAVKLVLNVHDLNNEGSVGQSLDIRQIRMVDEKGNPLPEMPAVSGRMMKHWHLEHMRKQELNQPNPILCGQCKVSEPERKPQDENNGVKTCVICDIHGFLCTDKPGFSAVVEILGDDIVLKNEAKNDEPEETISVIPCGHNSEDTNCPTCSLRKLSGKKVKVAGEFSGEEGSRSIKITYLQSGRGKEKVEIGISPKGLSLRRSSCVNFSWLLPVLNVDEQGKVIAPPAKQVIHSRVASGEIGEEGDTSQMIFHKSYASGMYGFVCSIDLLRIGKPIIGGGITDAVELKRRQTLAIKALLPMCLGSFGASQSHALPHTKCLGLLAALSTTEKPLPNLISPIYSNGFEESIKLLKSMNDSVKWWTYGDGMENCKGTINEVFDEIIKNI